MASSNSPSKKAVLEQLDKILESDEFKRSSRLSEFLEFVVAKKLEGQEQDIKGYTIGIEVFKKPEDFNPDTDASVRVEASRLRKALALYYFQKGREDLIEISIPKGSYVPKFEAHQKDHVPNSEEISIFPPSYRRFKARPYTYLFVIILMVLAMVSTVNYLNHLIFEDIHKPKHYQIPDVAVIDFYGIGERESKDLALLFADKLAEGLSYFNDIDVDRVEKKSLQDLLSEEHKDDAIEYALEGSVQKQDDDIRLSVNLVDLKTNLNLWSYDERYEFSQDFEQKLSDIAGQVAATLSSPYGVIIGLDRERFSNVSAPGLATYKCILTFYNYTVRKSEKGHLKSKECLEQAIAKKPQSPELWAYLSWIYGDMLRYGYNVSGTKKEILEKSYETAARAVEIDPNNARSQQYMAIAASLMKDRKKAVHHIKKAMDLNPYDSDIWADAAWQYAKIGDWTRSKEIAQRAIEINPSHPSWYHGTIFGYYFMNDDYVNALAEAIKYNQPEVLLSQIALAVSYAGVGEQAEAQKVMRYVEERWPDFSQNPKEPLSVWGFKEDFVDKLIADLRKNDLLLDS